MKLLRLTILCICSLALVQAQNAKLSFQVAYGAFDTVMVFGQSNTSSAVQINSLTSSILYDQQVTFQGFNSALNTAWGTTAENHEAEQAISKTYNGNPFQKQWSYGIAALGNTPVSLPANNTAPQLLFKVWFSSNGSNNFYVEDQAESIRMNAVTTATTNASLSYFVVAPGNQLPVELLGFEALPKGNQVELSWLTSNEFNNAGFEVERGENIRDFNAIGWVNSAGNSVRGHQYNFADAGVTPGQIYYYRLRQQDINGDFTYSQTVEVSVAQDGALSISNCFPNPSNNFTEVRIDSRENGRVQWRLFDAFGNKVKVGQAEVLAGSSSRIRIGLQSLAAGNYLLQFSSDNQLVTRKLSVH